MTFYNDVIQQSEYFNTMARVADLDLLEPQTRAAVQAIMEDAEANGTPLMLFETYRSAERQHYLYEQGETELSVVGTHHYGLAADLVRLVDGKPTWEVDYSFLGPIAEHHGMIWGGDWGDPSKHHRFVDGDHVQRVTLDDQEKLLAGVWYPDTDYTPV